jgi:hypothetical protein
MALQDMLSNKETASPIAFGSASIVTVLSLLVFIGFHFIEFFLEGEGGPGGAEANKLVFAVFFILGTNAGLAATGYYTWKNEPSTFTTGALAGFTAAFSIMSLVTSLYFADFTWFANDNNGDESRAMLIFSFLCLFYSAIYGFVTAGFYVLPRVNGTEVESSVADEELAKGRAHGDVLADMWNGIAIFSIAIHAIIQLIAFVSMFTEGGARARDEGYVFNFNAVVLVMLGVSAVSYIFGKKVFDGQATKMQIGTFTGALAAMAVAEFLLFALCELDFSFEFGGAGGAENDTAGSVAFGLVSLFQSVIHAFFATIMYKYKEAILRASTSEDTDSSFTLMADKTAV